VRVIEERVHRTGAYRNKGRNLQRGMTFSCLKKATGEIKKEKEKGWGEKSRWQLDVRSERKQFHGSGDTHQKGGTRTRIASECSTKGKESTV